ncbi:MAG: hypothetical protein V2I57_00155 [Xanthomonadales bacterium]|jgi:FMN phosphatase YigB (HAD superfamily)|nr:hypothetical protein [Xanthomonadales bacterium]
MMDGLEDIKAIAFDADDTLWVNETLFRETEDRFCEWVSDYLPADEARARLMAVEERNEEFLMVGNSLRSDVLPVLEIGAFAFHVPFHATWAHELAESPDGHPRFRAFEHVGEIPALLGRSRAGPGVSAAAGSAVPGSAAP